MKNHINITTFDQFLFYKRVYSIRKDDQPIIFTKIDIINNKFIRVKEKKRN